MDTVAGMDATGTAGGVTGADVVLLDAARSGDEQAFDALLAPHRRELHLHFIACSGR